MWPLVKSKNRPGLQLEFEEPGLFQLNGDEAVKNESDAEAYEVDIVAIHGLNGTPDGTWTHKNKTFWLKDLLPQDVRGARIFTYSYPSNVLFSKSKASTEEYAKTLLIELKVKRNGIGQERRPIIFIAHSLGGIVCKEALIIARQDPTYTPILDRTKGIIFFGTPHRGANASAEIGVFLSNVAQTALYLSGTRLLFGGSRSDQIKRLRANAPDLRRIIEGFRHLQKSIHIISVYETEEQIPLGRLVVDEASATLGIEGERTIPRYACHTEICRYRGSSDPGYTTILVEILDLCKKSIVDCPLQASEKACIDLFRRFDFYGDISSLSSERVDGTWEWLLETPEYRKWAQGTQANLLWVTGHPGSGKTMLSSYITDVLKTDQRATRGDFIICFFFCLELQRDDAKEILGSIIFQILAKRWGLIRHAKHALKHDEDGSNLFQSFDRLWALFTAIVSDGQLGSISIIIDGLDECNAASSHGLMERIAELLNCLKASRSRSLKFFITSRPELMLMKYFEADDAYEPLCLRLDDAQDEISADLRRVIQRGIRRIARNTKAKQGDIDELEEFLNKNADQSFLWAKLNLEILDGELSTAARDFRSILAAAPRGISDTYRRLLEKIQPKWAGFARDLLQIIVASLRPLTVEEINILITTQGMTREARQALTRIEEQQLRPNIVMDITKVLGSLVRISQSKVYLVHVTLKRFLTEDLLCPALSKSPNARQPELGCLELQRANLFLASACMAYLSLGCFTEDIYSEEPSCSSARMSLLSSHDDPQLGLEEEGSQRGLHAEENPVDGYIYGYECHKIDKVDAAARARVAERYKLFEYAATSWAAHFAEGQELASDDHREMALRLSDQHSQQNCLNWLRFFWSLTPWEIDILDQLAVAAFHGHLTSLKTLLSEADFINTDSLAIALHWASRNGHYRCVNILLETNVDPNAYIVACQSALCSAANIGHLEIVKALAKDSRVAINYRGFLGSTPLGLAAGSGNTEVVQYLLGDEHHKFVEINVGDWDGSTPLHAAVSDSHVSVVHILVGDSRVDVNYLNDRKQTPFFAAVRKRNAEIIQLLFGRPELDIDSPSGIGRTPLAEASSVGNSVVIEQLRRRRRLNISHSHKDEDGRNAISLAAESGNDAVIELLLDYKLPGIDEEDKSGWTPIFWALVAPTNTTLRLLLGTGLIHVNHQDVNGRTALSWAVSHGNECMLRTLFEEATGMNPLLEDRQGLTPLDWAQKVEECSNMAEILGGLLMK